MVSNNIIAHVQGHVESIKAHLAPKGKHLLARTIEAISFFLGLVAGVLEGTVLAVKALRPYLSSSAGIKTLLYGSVAEAEEYDMPASAEGGKVPPAPVVDAKTIQARVTEQPKEKVPNGTAARVHKADKENGCQAKEHHTASAVQPATPHVSEQAAHVTEEDYMEGETDDDASVTGASVDGSVGAEGNSNARRKKRGFRKRVSESINRVVNPSQHKRAALNNHAAQL